MSLLDAPLPPAPPGSKWVIWYGGECIEIPQDVVDRVLSAPSAREANRIGMEWLLSRPGGPVMSERFIKVEVCQGEYAALQATPRGRYTLTTSDGIESSAVELSLEQFRQLLALFPELTRPAAPEEKT